MIASTSPALRSQLLVRKDGGRLARVAYDVETSTLLYGSFSDERPRVRIRNESSRGFAPDRYVADRSSIGVLVTLGLGARHSTKLVSSFVREFRAVDEEFAAETIRRARRIVARFRDSDRYLYSDWRLRRRVDRAVRSILLASSTEIVR